MEIKKSNFGFTKNGEQVELFSLKNDKITVDVITYGGTITSIKVPDKNGKIIDIALGFNSIAEYESSDNQHLGCITGRYAGRINKGEFEIDGIKYNVNINKPDNVHLHGGFKGIDKYIWHPKEIFTNDYVGVELTHSSNDGDEGYPGNVNFKIQYLLTNNDKLIIDYYASTDKATPLNLTNHTYFNLNGEDSELSILNHSLKITADEVLEVDYRAIPTGKKVPVFNTPMDLNELVVIGERIFQKYYLLDYFGGYDHTWVLRNKTQQTPPITLLSEYSGIKLDVFTDQPGVVCYTGNGLKGKLIGKTGKIYSKHYGVCLETQSFPDAMNHLNFPNTIITPSKPYKQTTIWQFSVIK